MDTLLDYVFDYRVNPVDSIPRPQLREGMSIRLARPEDVEALATVSREAFRNHFGRIHADPRIGQDRATRFYEEWIRSSCQGYGDWIVIAEAGDQIAGLSVWRKPSSEESAFGIKMCHYSIGAIHPNHHGQGLFTAITHAGMDILAEHADYVEGPTHASNQPVQRGYAKLGWKIGDARYSFHKWI
jgi:RimJ/RimL family protein N-acetyltransferase